MSYTGLTEKKSCKKQKKGSKEKAAEYYLEKKETIKKKSRN